MAAAVVEEHVAVVLLGGRWAGKSSSGNSLLELDCTSKGFNVGKQTDTCIMKKTNIEGTMVSVIDTPSWMWVPAEDTSEEVKDQLRRSVTMAEDAGTPAFLFVYPLGSPFVRRHKVAVEQHLALLAGGKEEKVWEHTMVLFSRGDWLVGRGTTIEEHLQTAGPELRWLLEKCGNRYHVINNKEKERETIKELLKKIKEMLRKREETEEGRQKMLQDKEKMLQEKENMIQEKEEILRQREEMVQKREEILAEKEKMLRKGEGMEGVEEQIPPKKIQRRKSMEQTPLMIGDMPEEAKVGEPSGAQEEND